LPEPSAAEGLVESDLGESDFGESGLAESGETEPAALLEAGGDEIGTVGAAVG
jgi:hypothetical protein